MADQTKHPIVFFDGLCGFCDRSVTFLFQRDKKHALRFAALQGKTAERLLTPPLRESLETMVLADGEKIYTRSTAALRSLAAIGGAWRVLALVLLMVPAPLRNAVYKVVVKYRYKIFGKHDTCRLPSREERSYFLD